MSKRHRISLFEKVQLIKLREREKITQRTLAERFGIGKTQVNFILSQKDKLLADFHAGLTGKTMNKLSPERLQLDRCCLEWVMQMRSRNEAFTGPILRQKAREIARRLKISNFSGSEGWLYRFRRRHNLSLKNGCNPIESEQLSLSIDAKEIEEDVNDDSVVGMVNEEQAIDNKKMEAGQIVDLKPTLSDVIRGLQIKEGVVANATVGDNNSFFFEVPKEQIQQLTESIRSATKYAKSDVVAWQSVPKEIETIADALKYINNLKIFLQHDYAAMHLATNLETVLQHRASLEK